MQPSQHVIGELVFQADRIPPSRPSWSGTLPNPFRTHETPQPVIVHLSASAVLWAFTEHTEKISKDLSEWHDLDLWGKLKSAQRNQIQISRDSSFESLQVLPTSEHTFRVLLPQPSDSLLLDFGQDCTAAERWCNALRLMTLPWRMLLDQSSKHVVRDLQNAGLIKATKPIQKPATSASQSHHPTSQEASLQVSQEHEDVIDILHVQRTLVDENVQSGRELVRGVLEALEITLPVYEQICTKLPLVSTAVQLTCFGLSSISKVMATQIDIRRSAAVELTCFGVSTISKVMAPQIDIRRVAEVRKRVNRIASLILLEMLQADYTGYKASDEYIHSLERVMAGLEAAHASLDRYIISGVLFRTWAGAIATDVMSCLDDVGANLNNLSGPHTRNLGGPHATLNTAVEVRRFQQDLRHWRISVANSHASNLILPNTYDPRFQMPRRVGLARMPILKRASSM